MVMCDRGHVTAKYWDTPDLKLARAGSTLRYRADQGWCAKLGTTEGGAALVRDEIIAAGESHRPPDRILAHFKDFAEGRLLGPVVDLEADRDVFEVTDDTGASVGVITDDLVNASGAAVRTPRFREIEIELSEGADERRVDPLLDALVAAGADRSDPRPKLLRALGLTRGPTSRGT